MKVHLVLVLSHHPIQILCLICLPYVSVLQSLYFPSIGPNCIRKKKNNYHRSLAQLVAGRLDVVQAHWLHRTERLCWTRARKLPVTIIIETSGEVHGDNENISASNMKKNISDTKCPYKNPELTLATTISVAKMNAAFSNEHKCNINKRHKR